MSPELEYLQAQQALSQQQLAFYQRMRHSNHWFILRLAFGAASLVLLPSILALSAYILLSPDTYSPSVLLSAAGALFADSLALFAGLWKVVLSKDSQGDADPLTGVPDGSSERGPDIQDRERLEGRVLAMPDSSAAAVQQSNAPDGPSARR